MTRVALVASLLALALAAPAAAGDEAPRLSVQRRWRLAAVAFDADPRLRLERVFARTARTIERELPGLELDVSEPVRSYPLPSGGVGGTDRAVAEAALRAAEADGLAIGEFDVIFVFTPHVRGPYFGLSHLDVEAKDGTTARAALIHTRPIGLAYRSLLATLEGRPLPGFQTEEPLPPRVREAVARVLALLGPLVERADRSPRLAEPFLAATLAHEFGHFLAPGDLDVRDGYQERWLAHATGEQDNPDGHGLECCMYKGRGLEFYVRKLLVTRGRLVRFCDPCREQMGCAPRAPRRVRF